MMIYEIYDERAEIIARHGQKKHVKTLPNVPDALRLREVMTRFGIAAHLTVYRTTQCGSVLVHAAAR